MISLVKYIIIEIQIFAIIQFLKNSECITSTINITEITYFEFWLNRKIFSLNYVEAYFVQVDSNLQIDLHRTFHGQTKNKDSTIPLLSFFRSCYVKKCNQVVMILAYCFFFQCKSHIFPSRRIRKKNFIILHNSYEVIQLCNYSMLNVFAKIIINISRKVIFAQI